MQQPTINPIFEPVTGTWQYLVADDATSQAVIIDLVLDFDSSTSRISTASADKLLDAVSEHSYLHRATYNGSSWDRGQQRPDLCIGKRIKDVQALFGKRYGVKTDEIEDAFDKTFDDNEKFRIGDIEVSVFHLPGHTPDHVGCVIGSNVLTGDSTFNADVGSARCDFPGGSATQLYNNIQTLPALPEDYRLYTGHDYPPAGRESAKPYCMVKEQREGNKHANVKVLEEDFVDWRSGRDVGLSEPKLIYQALQVNIRAGKLPGEGEEGYRFLKVPVKVVKGVL